MADIVLDLETLDVKSTAAIIEIGAVALESGKYIREFQCFVERDRYTSKYTISEDTIEFHRKVGTNIDRDGLPIEVALLNFSTWLQQFSDNKIWGRGSDFDNVILAHAYQVENIELPWKFTNNRCLRTLEQVRGFIWKGVERRPWEKAHSAIGDARYEARLFIEH